MNADKLKTLREKTMENYTLQGNFDPDILMTTPEIIDARLKEMLSSVKNLHKGYIINLGHGIGQFTPVANAKYFVKRAKELAKELIV